MNRDESRVDMVEVNTSLSGKILDDVCMSVRPVYDCYRRA